MIDGNDRLRLQEAKRALLDTLRDEKVNDVPVLLLINYKDGQQQQQQQNTQRQRHDDQHDVAVTITDAEEAVRAADGSAIEARMTLEELNDELDIVGISESTDRHVAIKSISAIDG